MPNRFPTRSALFAAAAITFAAPFVGISDALAKEDHAVVAATGTEAPSGGS